MRPPKVRDHSFISVVLFCSAFFLVATIGSSALSRRRVLPAGSFIEARDTASLGDSNLSVADTQDEGDSEQEYLEAAEEAILEQGNDGNISGEDSSLNANEESSENVNETANVSQSLSDGSASQSKTTLQELREHKALMAAKDASFEEAKAASEIEAVRVRHRYQKRNRLTAHEKEEATAIILAEMLKLSSEKQLTEQEAMHQMDSLVSSFLEQEKLAETDSPTQSEEGTKNSFRDKAKEFWSNIKNSGKKLLERMSNFKSEEEKDSKGTEEVSPVMTSKSTDFLKESSGKLVEAAKEVGGKIKKSVESLKEEASKIRGNLKDSAEDWLDYIRKKLFSQVQEGTPAPQNLDEAVSMVVAPQVKVGMDMAFAPKPKDGEFEAQDNSPPANPPVNVDTKNAKEGVWNKFKRVAKSTVEKAKQGIQKLKQKLRKGLDNIVNGPPKPVNYRWQEGGNEVDDDDIDEPRAISAAQQEAKVAAGCTSGCDNEGKHQKAE